MPNQNPWILKKTILPQHVDHAGVMWHGSYLQLMEEARLNALEKVQLPYKEITLDGYEMPVASMEIKYKIALRIFEITTIQTFFLPSKGIKWPCKTIFFNENGSIAAISLMYLVLVRKTNNQSLNLIRHYPDKINIAFLKLQNGPY